MERFYFEKHRTRDIAAVDPCLYGLGRPTISGASRSPVGGGNGGHVEMAECLISKRGLEVHFQPTCWKFTNPTNAMIFRYPPPSSCTSVY